MEFQFKHFALNHSLSTMKVGTDAVLLSAIAPLNQPKNILDVGTGCGVVALAMAQLHQEAMVVAIDIDEASIFQAEDNFSHSPFAERMQAEQISLQDFANLEANHARFDLIVSNPPFFVDSLNAPNRRRNLARHTDMLPFSDFAQSVSRLCTPNAQIAVILPPEQMKCLAGEMIKHHLMLSLQTNIYSKASKPVERVVGVFSLSPTATTTSSLILRNEDNTYTQAYKDLVSDLLL